MESGSLAIHGAILNPTDVLQVIAPATHALPIIECAPHSKKRKIEKPASATEYDATFRLESLTTGLGNVGMVCPRFDKIWRPPLFMTETGEQNGTTSFTPVSICPLPDGLYMCAKLNDGFKIFTSAQHIPTITIPPSWQSPLSSLASAKNGHRVVFITGGKSVGKSTFGKCLMNQIITNSATPKKSVAYMDVDPGQPSFTPPCMVSLHTVTAPNVAPSYASFNSTTLLRQHHIGYTSPREDPRYYLRCAADLYKHYRAMVDAGDEMTLIVNTCGWIKGLGRELLRELVNACSPTDVVGLGDMEGVFADIIPPNLVCKTYQLEGAGTSGPSQLASVSQVGITNGGGSATQQYSPADLRLLQTIAYFHCNSDNEPGAEIFDFGTHMTGLRPIIASFQGAERAIDAITVIDAEITPDLLSTTINATIVAINLIKSESKGHPVLSYLEGLGAPDQDTTSFIPSELFDGTTSLLPPEDTTTVGLAIVRAVDHQRGELQILTPIAEDMFQRWIETGYRIVFTRGRDEMPVWLLWDWRKGRGGISAAHTKGSVANITNDGNPEAASGTPYLDFVVGGEVSGKGAKEWKVRRNIMRRSQHRAGK